MCGQPKIRYKSCCLAAVPHICMSLYILLFEDKKTRITQQIAPLTVALSSKKVRLIWVRRIHCQNGEESSLIIFNWMCWIHGWLRCRLFDPASNYAWEATLCNAHLLLSLPDTHSPLVHNSLNAHSLLLYGAPHEMHSQFISCTNDYIRSLS